MPGAPATPWIRDVSNVAFHIGSFPIAWYSIFILIGFALAIFLSCMKLWKWYKVPVDPFYWFILIGIPTAIIGANFWSCVLGPDNGGKEWSQFFTSFGTGLAIEGGVMFTVAAALIYFPLVLRRPKYHVRDLGSGEPQVRKISFWIYADAIIPTILIAQFIGRWGNYMNQEVYGGVVTNEALAWWLHDHLPWMYIGGQWKQPLFLYEGIGNLFMFFILFFAAEFIPKKKAGDIAFFYFVWYGSLRMGLEPLRDPTFRSGSFGVTMITSLMFVLVGVVLIICNHTVLKKAQKYNLWFMIKTYIKIGFSSLSYKTAKNKYERKMKSLNKKIDDSKVNIEETESDSSMKIKKWFYSVFKKEVPNEQQKLDLQKQVNETNSKLDIKNQWFKKTSDEFVEDKKAFKRTDAQMLFYFGRY